MLRHADVGRTSTFDDGVTVSVWVKDVDGNWSDAVATKGEHDARRMLLDFDAGEFDAGEVEIRGLRLTFEGLCGAQG